MGLFADEPLVSGDRITAYGGAVYEDEEDYEENCPKGRKGVHAERYLMQGETKWIDGYRGFRLLEQGRWANTQRTLKECNAKFSYKGDLIWIEATKPIAQGEEIFVWYGADYANKIFAASKK